MNVTSNTVQVLESFLDEKKQQAETCEKRGDNREAIRLYRRCIEIARNLVVQSDNPRFVDYLNLEIRHFETRVRRLQNPAASISEYENADGMDISLDDFLINLEDVDIGKLVGLEHIFRRLVFNLRLIIQAFNAGDSRFCRYIRASALFAGPPGTGKTTLAAQLARTLGLPLFYARASSFLNHLFGATVRKIASFFEMVRSHGSKNGLTIVFVDEIDDLLAESASGHDAQERIRSVLRTEMEGLTARSRFPRFYLIGATNVPYRIPDNQTDKFGHIFLFSKPDEKTRLSILSSKFHEHNFTLANDINLAYYAARTQQASGRDLEKIVQLAVESMLMRANPYLVDLDNSEAMHPGSSIREEPISLQDLEYGFRRILSEIRTRSNEKWKTWEARFHGRIE